MHRFLGSEIVKSLDPFRSIAWQFNRIPVVVACGPNPGISSKIIEIVSRTVASEPFVKNSVEFLELPIFPCHPWAGRSLDDGGQMDRHLEALATDVNVC